MLVNQIGSTTTIYAKSNLTGVSSTTPTSSLVTSSTTASTTATTRTTASTTVSVVRSSSATAKATSSATLVYGASSTAKTVVSSTTAKSVSSTTTRAVSSSTTVNRASGSTTPSVTSSDATSAVFETAEIGAQIGKNAICYVSKEKLIGIGFSNVDDEMVDELNSMLEKYGITDKNEINHFLAQCYVESWFGKSTVEIRFETYPIIDEASDRKYFNDKYYMSAKLGNIDEDDGYKYRGAGYIQVTGRYNYNEFSKAMNDPLIFEEGTSYVAENYAWEASCWFWMTFVHGVFEANNNPTVIDVTVEVNEGYAAIEEREKEYNLIVEYDKQLEE